MDSNMPSYPWKHVLGSASTLLFFCCFTLGPTFKYFKEFEGTPFSFRKEKGHESSMVKLKQNHKQKCEVKIIFINEKKWLMQIGT